MAEFWECLVSEWWFPQGFLHRVEGKGVVVELELADGNEDRFDVWGEIANGHCEEEGGGGGDEGWGNVFLGLEDC